MSAFQISRSPVECNTYLQDRDVFFVWAMLKNLTCIILPFIAARLSQGYACLLNSPNLVNRRNFRNPALEETLPSVSAPTRLVDPSDLFPLSKVACVCYATITHTQLP